MQSVPKPMKSRLSPDIETATASNRFNKISHLSSTKVPDDILAFRTMTSLLSKIQQSDASVIIEDLPDRGSERQEVKILSALASFIVMDNEVIAVAAKRTTQAGDNTGKGRVEVIINTHSTDESLLISPPQSSILGDIVRYLFSKNARSENTTTATGPLLMEPTPPAGFETVEQWINAFWFNISLSSHVWVLTKMLNDKNLEMLSYYYYVTSTCIRKICHRFHHPLSMPFFEALTSLDKKVTFTLAPPAPPTQVDDPRGRDKERKLDMAALKWVLIALAADEQAAYPVLVKKAKEDVDENFKLYCADTCQEYHNFLCHLLKFFSNCLLSLKEDFTKDKHPYEATGNTVHLVKSIVLYALALQDMVASPAFLQHLRNIQVPLRSHLSIRNSMAMEATATGPGNLDQDSDDFKAVQPNALRDRRVLALPEAYEKWLKLVLTHYEAANILFKYVTSKSSNVSVIEMQILDTPLVGSTMLAWRGLFSSGSSGSGGPTAYIPDIPDSRNEPSNAEIYEFLNNGTKLVSSQYRSQIIEGKKRFRLLETRPDKFHQDIDNVIKFFSHPRDGWPAWKTAAQEITKSLEEMKEHGAYIYTLRRSTEEIFEALLTSLSFFNFLETMEFKGCEHCEVSLSGYLSQCNNLDASIENIVQKLAGYGRVIGVSKRCCPVCRSILLKLLPESVPFIVRGSHNTYYPCSLPIWFPKEIADKMNLELGLALRKELVDLMERSGLFRPRPPSSGSRRLSHDSSEGDIETVVSPQSIKDLMESVTQTSKMPAKTRK